jgi:kumamolisin
MENSTNFGRQKQERAVGCLGALLAMTLVIGGVAPSFAQGQGQGHAPIIIPATSIENPGDVGVRAHTNHLIRADGFVSGTVMSPSGSASTLPKGETPASLRTVYNLPSTGGSGIIAIVDAYHYSTAANDLAVFSKQFGLSSCTTSTGCFKVVYASGKQPVANCGWAQEAALDIEWAHAMSPNAKIVLVEAASNSIADLLAAVDVATSQVTTGGGKGEVSMSWGGSEFATETSNDSHFQNINVVYVAASGDTGGVNQYPSVSPYVISAGGTTINRSSTGAFLSETAWSGSGSSLYETKLSYQNNILNTNAVYRSAPDMSFDANPQSGVLVYDSTTCSGVSGWLVFGGTSVSSPAIAGIINLAAASGGGFATNTVGELTKIYANARNTADFRDITSGTAGSFSALTGYDFVTGLGSSLGLAGK